MLDHSALHYFIFKWVYKSRKYIYSTYLKALVLGLLNKLQATNLVLSLLGSLYVWVHD